MIKARQEGGTMGGKHRASKDGHDQVITPAEPDTDLDVEPGAGIPGYVDPDAGLFGGGVAAVPSDWGDGTRGPMEDQEK